MKIEIDFAEAIEKYPVKEMDTKSGQKFYVQQLNIKTKYYTTTLIVKSYNKDLIKTVQPKQTELKEGDKIEKKKK